MLPRDAAKPGLGFLSLLLALFTSTGMAQNPPETLPHNYRVVLENQWVRVVKVHYAPHEKVPVHNHAEGEVIYVYLADGGPVRFQHFTPRQVLAIRPPIKQGGFRMHHALVERHSVENMSDLPSDFLRVELKALPAGNQLPDAKFDPPSISPSDSSESVDFENADVRIVRSVCAAHKVCASREIGSDSVEVSFTPASLVESGMQIKSIGLQAGQVRWLTQMGKEEVSNTGETDSHRLRIESKGTRLRPSH
jgi:hypothetical protein